MRAVTIVVAVLLLVVAIGCSQIRVRSDYDEDIDFSKYQTFRMAEWKGDDLAARPNPLLKRRVNRALEAELNAKGYTQREQGKPDFIVAFHTGIKKRVAITEDYYPYRWRRGFGKRVSVHTYKEGSLVVDVIDADSKTIVWRGWATGVINRPDQAEEQIRESVTKVLAQFPPE